MLFSAVSSLALLSATAIGSTVQLSIESDNQDVNNNGLSSIHEGAGINYFFLGKESQTIDYDESTGILSFASSPDVVQSFGVSANIVQLSVASSSSPVKFTSDNLLSFNGTTSNFYACKNINDPYSYSKTSYALSYYDSDAPDACIAVKVKVTEAAASSSSAAPSSTAPASSSAPASSAPEVSSATNGAGANAAAGSLVGGAALLFGLLA